jgi:hypothetical protein
VSWQSHDPKRRISAKVVSVWRGSLRPSHLLRLNVLTESRLRQTRNSIAANPQQKTRFRARRPLVFPGSGLPDGDDVVDPRCLEGGGRKQGHSVFPDDADAAMDSCNSCRG